MLSCANKKNLSEAELKVKNRFSVITNRNGEVIRRLNEQEQTAAFFGHYSLTNARSLVSNDVKDTCFSTRYYKTETPTLTMAANIYGAAQISNWMQSNLEVVAETTGTKGQWTPMQMQIAANMLLDKFNSGNIHLNMREVLLFFYRWMGGQFGHFYGSTDIQLIGQAADAFLDYRHEEVTRIEREQEETIRKEKTEKTERNTATVDERKEAILRGLRENPKSLKAMLALGFITAEEAKEFGEEIGQTEEEEKSEDEIRKEHLRQFQELLNKETN